MKLQVKTHAPLIQALQDRLSLNQRQSAKKLGTTTLCLNRWKHGHTTPSPMAIALLKQAVNDLGDRGRDLQRYF